MCTVVVSFEPGSRLPLIILAVRDELLGRPWLPPEQHWPEYPGVIGGLDLLAGGTWLALDPAAHRVGFVLNGVGQMASPVGRRSRGELPLLMTEGGSLPGDLIPFDPFHLVTADPAGVTMVSWDGERRSDTLLPPGITVIVNSGLDPAEPRAERLIPLLAKAIRPEPQPGDSPQTAWGQWLELASGQDIAREDPRALILRGLTPDNVAHGSSSVTLLAMSRDYLRFDFVAVPQEPGPLSELQVILDERA